MVLEKLKRKPSVLFIVVYIFLIFSIKTIIPYVNFISFDNFGYYMHLPAKYIYADVELKTGWFEKVTEKYKNTGYYSQTTTTQDNKRIMRFYKGMSYLWIPPFVVGHLYAKMFGYEADGFSLPYHTALVYYGAIFSILGVILSRKILRYYFDERITAITLFIFFIGTSIFYFSTLGSDVPHIYLFTLFVSLIYWTIKWHDKPKIGYMLLLAISMGLIIAIRPSDVFIAIIPIMWGVYNKKTLTSKLHLLYANINQVFIAILICVIFILPQLIYYYKYTGSLIINIYNDPGAAFDFLHPRVAYVLFGFRKGWFIYSPLILLGFIGLFILRKRHKDYFLACLIYFTILIYLIASFNSLVSFGWRAFLQSTALLIIPTGYFVHYIAKQKVLVKITLGIIVSAFIILNIHQAYQFKLGVLDGSMMTRKYYFAVLGKNSVSEDDKKLLIVERPINAIKTLPEGIEFKNNKLLILDFEDAQINDSSAPIPYNGHGMFMLNKNINYSPAYKNSFKNICTNYYCYLKISVFVYSDANLKDSLFLVADTKNLKNKSISWKGATIDDAGNTFTPGKWNHLEAYYITPEVYSREEIIESYIWYRGKNKVWIDDFCVRVYEPIEQ